MKIEASKLTQNLIDQVKTSIQKAQKLQNLLNDETKFSHSI